MKGCSERALAVSIILLADRLDGLRRSLVTAKSRPPKAPAVGKAREEKHALAERSRFRRRDRPRAALLDDARRELRRGLARRSSARTASSARGVDPGRVASRAGADAERPSAEVRVEPGYVAVHHSGERTRRAIDRFGAARGRRTRATARPRDRATARASGPGDRARTPRAARGGFAGSPRPQRPASVVTSSAELVPPKGTEKTRHFARWAPAPPRGASRRSRRVARLFASLCVHGGECRWLCLQLGR